MHKKILSLVLAVLLCTSLAVPTSAAGLETDNYNSQNYSTWASTVTSYLFENPEGGLTRVEYGLPCDEYGNRRIFVEDYDSSLTFLERRSIPMELSFWGGFFAGDDYNYFIFGQNNPNEDNDVEVVRVVKYSKNWERLGAASLRGANTTEPFSGGSLRCAEYGGYLYIRTCHTMYASSDGTRHQANMAIVVKENDMTISDAHYNVSYDYSYVSHSFNQFVMIDQDQNIVTMDHGDAYPRAIVLTKDNGAKGGEGIISSSYTATNLVEFKGATGQNSTGASAGGLAETSTGYVAAYSDNGTGSGEKTRHVYLAHVGKDGTVSTTQVSQKAGTYNTPVLAPMGLNGGYILWGGIGDTYWYAAYDADGQVSEAKPANLALSDCQPILYNGKLIWYVTNYFWYLANYSQPVFYTLDESGVISTLTPSGGEPSPSPSPTPGTMQFTDVKADAFYYDAVQWAVEKGVTSGTTATTFSPSNPCDRGQIVTFLWRANGKPEPTSTYNPFVDVKSGDYYYKAVLWAVEKNITSGTDATHFSPTTPCTRGQAMTFLWRANGEPSGSGKTFSDVKTGQFYSDAVQWAVGKNITSGTSSTTFSPGQSCTRGQIVTFLYRDKQ